MQTRVLTSIILCAALASCAPVPREPLPRRPTPVPTPAPVEAPDERPGQTPTPVEPVPPPPPPVPQKRFTLGSASSALVTQARTQAKAGNTEMATATLERALRIEPNNPLIWIELGQVYLADGNNDQANSMGRKALRLATGDPIAQDAAKRLISESSNR